MNKHICIKWVKGLTVGATYTEVVKASGHLNVCVTNDEGEYQDVDRGYMITQNELETLKAVETHGQNLNTISLASLLEKGLIYTEWSDYGYKISEAGTQLLDGDEA